ncbi:SAM-dependent methyltransferase [Actinomadura atramentaria]|uniref:SAM-dependent methyltransferase n=1 Tax=Actinomadura atramentaria TaxID=1990 RepID=UPI00037FBEC7|nr:SAM-dependent methyltransferase [Actinomadura atramentaria]
MSHDPSSTFDLNKPSPARMYDYFLGGKDNYAVDREAAAKVDAAVGKVMTHDIVWENRLFLQRATRFLAESGIDQFLDLGTGLPTRGNVHEIAQEVTPDAHVVYVDNDPIVLTHGRALLAKNATTTIITADVRDPAGILENPQLGELIDFSRPVGLLSVALFHFISDHEDPAGILRAFHERLCPGSYLVLSHLTTDGPSAEKIGQVTDAYKNATSPIVFRPRAEIESFFDGFDVQDPGLVRPWSWRPAYGESGPQTEYLYAAVARVNA